MGEFGRGIDEELGSGAQSSRREHKRAEASQLGTLRLPARLPDFLPLAQGGEGRQCPIRTDKRIFGICPHM